MFKAAKCPKRQIGPHVMPKSIYEQFHLNDSTYLNQRDTLRSTDLHGREHTISAEVTYCKVSFIKKAHPVGLSNHNWQTSEPEPLILIILTKIPALIWSVERSGNSLMWHLLFSVEVGFIRRWTTTREHFVFQLLDHKDRQFMEPFCWVGLRNELLRLSVKLKNIWGLIHIHHCRPFSNHCPPSTLPWNPASEKPYVHSHVFLLDYVQTDLYTEHNCHVQYNESCYMIRKSAILSLFLAPHWLSHRT